MPGGRTAGQRREPVALVPMVANIVGILTCFPTAIAGVWFACDAWRKAASGELSAARRAVRLSWLCLVPSLLVVVFFFATQPASVLGAWISS
ncbi:hypothetical protein FHX37_4114 [Haloactinospora alba]|uniref:Interferon-induced transmembrane protein n=1 Tax=Haloactinospora alba TaxID=405555 RepID=A0A543NAB0_9ACTN|nr:hypothetical protein [Haloactinospora alba]TQN28750.1 hypothetical protein FHX37_4114 [Haloactinospora alba]